ncbi:MAG TPA: M23 family metallopeptidase [Candidatus Binatia bacterium]|nr:M23 family metallopeptidase [Candidatus Binatia bacterium]
MPEKARTSTLALAALIAVSTATAGAFGFSTGLDAWTERHYAETAALPRAENYVPPAAAAPDVPKHRLVPARAVVHRLPAPIARASERVTKKPFGLEVHPETSPVPNDKFNGFHVGVDFETFDDELDAAVPISAVCDGPLLFKKWATGYGGVAVQGCVIGAEEVSVIYGHLDVASVRAEPGERLAAGEFVGDLGAGHTEQTDGARKHLHLGIRLGRTGDIRGYVKDPADEALFLDARDYLALE